MKLNEKYDIHEAFKTEDKYKDEINGLKYMLQQAKNKEMKAKRNIFTQVDDDLPRFMSENDRKLKRMTQLQKITRDQHMGFDHKY